MDEAHNIEDGDRGLRIELLLATIRRDPAEANFLLLMPMVPNAEDLASWLASGRRSKTVIGVLERRQEIPHTNRGHGARLFRAWYEYRHR